ncbi:MAG: hypothetical protein U1A78_33840 [Polyangia bacterium]
MQDAKALARMAVRQALAEADDDELRAFLEREKAVAVRLAECLALELLDRKRGPWPAASRWAVLRLHTELLRSASAEARNDVLGLLAARRPRWEAGAEALAAVLASTVAQHPTSGLSLHLRADPNPDFSEDEALGSVRLGSVWVPVSSLGQARKVAARFREQHALGAGNWTGGHIRRRGQRYARLAYNLRLFEDRDDGQELGDAPPATRRGPRRPSAGARPKA